VGTYVVKGNADVVEGDVTVAMGRIVVPEDAQHAVNGDTGGVGWNEDNGLLKIGIFVVGVAFAHDNVDLAAWIASTRAPPFL